MNSLHFFDIHLKQSIHSSLFCEFCNNSGLTHSDRYSFRYCGCSAGRRLVEEEIEKNGDSLNTLPEYFEVPF